MTEAKQDELFDETPVKETTTTEATSLEELVGEGKKFKTVDDLAKSKLEADRFIEQLKGEMQGLRDDLNNRLSMEDYLKKLDQKATDLYNKGDQTMSDGSSNQSNTSSGEKPKENLSIEEIEAIVEKRVAEREARSRVEQNVAKVQSMGEKAFGPNYRQVYAEKAKALGLDQNVLKDMAERSPDGFLNIMGVTDALANNQAKESSQAIFGGGGGSTNSEARTVQSQSGKPKLSDFNRMRKEDPKQYWSPEVQNRLMRYTAELGEDFLNN